MFRESAEWYDAFYGEKDYAGEAAMVVAAAAHHVPGFRHWLDVACGTGRHLEFFASQSQSVTGLDLDPGLLAVARSRCPGAELVEGDMRDFDLGRRFDVVTCLFSAIGYVVTLDGLHAAVAAMARHVAAPGLLVIEPWITPDGWREGGLVLTQEVEYAGGRLLRMMASGRRHDLTWLDMHYLFGRAGQVEHRSEYHQLGLFTFDQYLEAVEAAGLTAELDREGLIGRGLVLGTRPAAR